jgi:hypothetical protein
MTHTDGNVARTIQSKELSLIVVYNPNSVHAVVEGK